MLEFQRDGDETRGHRWLCTWRLSMIHVAQQAKLWADHSRVFRYCPRMDSQIRLTNNLLSIKEHLLFTLSSGGPLVTATANLAH